jgi:hypothetical protein
VARGAWRELGTGNGEQRTVNRGFQSFAIAFFFPRGGGAPCHHDDRAPLHDR